MEVEVKVEEERVEVEEKMEEERVEEERVEVEEKVEGEKEDVKEEEVWRGQRSDDSTTGSHVPRISAPENSLYVDAYLAHTLILIPHVMV